MLGWPKVSGVELAHSGVGGGDEEERSHLAQARHDGLAHDPNNNTTTAMHQLLLGLGRECRLRRAAADTDRQLYYYPKPPQLQKAVYIFKNSLTRLGGPLR